MVKKMEAAEGAAKKDVLAQEDGASGNAPVAQSPVVTDGADVRTLVTSSAATSVTTPTLESAQPGADGTGAAQGRSDVDDAGATQVAPMQQPGIATGWVRPAPAVPNTQKGLRIASRKESFRRAGRRFTAVPIDIALTDLSTTQIQQLRADKKNLMVVDIDMPLA